jgi:xanthine dehydrogenase iron-sulfur cluster and FAD-binding subunit A
MKLSAKHKKTLDAIFDTPARSDVAWDDIVKLLAALDAEISEGRGSRVRIALGGVRAVFHRPHPRKETEKGTLKSLRRFLTEAGVRP